MARDFQLSLCKEKKGALLPNEWVKMGQTWPRYEGELPVLVVKKFVMIWRGENINVCATQIASRLFALNNKNRVI